MDHLAPLLSRNKHNLQIEPKDLILKSKSMWMACLGYQYPEK